MKTRHRSMLTITATAFALVGATAACGSDTSGGEASGSTDDASIEAGVANYAEGVHASYAASVASATEMDAAIDAFVADPTDETLSAAKQAWLSARDDYGPTEAFRFYGGPIDDEEVGIEGLVNAWPLDEAYIDGVEGNESAGIINDPATYPVIEADLLLSLNEEGGESNISTGWHAIEFLLWGQDLSADGPGERPVTDYTSADNADRRAEFLTVASDVLVEHLASLEAAWSDDGDNYRAEFEALDSAEALRLMITGIGELSRGELAGERMSVAYTERSQEDEHSCFSDNTTNDIIANAVGIEQVLTGDYPGVSGPGVVDMVAAVDSDLAATLEAQITESLTLVRAIPAPFDQHLADGVSDDDPGRASVLTAIEALENQTSTIVAAAEALGVTINVT